MDLIKRPKKVQRAEKGYLTNEKYQDYAEQQFKNIYEKTDEIIKNLGNGGAQSSGGIPTESIIGFEGNKIPEGFEEVENPNEYSTKEIKTNEIWADGKPIYQKVIPLNISHTADATAKQYETVLNIENIENVWVDQSHSFITTGGVNYILGRVFVQNNAINFSCGANVNATRLQVEIYYSRTTMAITGYITIKYTKTTD